MVKVPAGRPLWPAISERRADDEQLVFDEGPKYVGTGEWELLEYSRTFGLEGVKTRGYWRLGGAIGEAGVFYLDAVPPPVLPGPTDPLEVPVVPAPPPLSTVIDPAPVVSAFGMTKRRFAAVGGAAPPKVTRGTRFTYALSEQARVAITIFRRRSTRVVTLVARGRTGPQSAAFSGRVRKGPLAPGAYRAQIVATDASGQTSEPRSVSFRIVVGG